MNYLKHWILAGFWKLVELDVKDIYLLFQPGIGF